jgi:hypothetical protein
MSPEHQLTLKTLAAAVRDLTPAIEELNRQQRRAARVEDWFVVVEHELHRPPEQLAVWPSEKGAVYQFRGQSFGEGWNVTSDMCTLGYSINVKHCYSRRKGLSRRVFGGWTSASQSANTFVRLLVVDDGVPALFLDGNRYSGDVEGWREVVRDTGWTELQP